MLGVENGAIQSHQGIDTSNHPPILPPPSHPSQTRTILRTAGSVASIIGSSFYSLGKKGAGAITGGTVYTAKAIGSCTASALATTYQVVPGARGAAQFVAEHAVMRWVLPELGIFKQKIEERQEYLNKTSQSSVCSEACHFFATYATEYLNHQIFHADKIAPSLRAPFVNILLYETRSTTSRYSLTGDVLRHTLEKRPGLVTEIIEANLLKVFQNFITYFTQLQKENPHWLVDLTKDLLAGYTEELKKINSWQAEKEIPPEIAEKALTQALSKVLLKIGLPNGAADLELPVAFSSMGAAYLRETFETTLFPAIIDYGCLKGTSEYTRDFIVMKIFDWAKEFISCGTVADFTSSSTAVNEPKQISPYPHKESFSQILKTFSESLLEFLNPELCTSAKKWGIPEVIQTHGGDVAATLSQFDIITLTNTALTLLVPIMNDGRWVEETDKKRFTNAPFTFLTTIAEKEAGDALQVAKQVEMRKKTETTVQELAKDFNGISTIGAKKVIGSPSHAEIERILKEGTFLENVRLCTHMFLLNTLQGILKFLCWLLGQKGVQKTGELFYQ
ncbi:MAG: hypothetical protein JWO53_1232, partial [Chlamydiia bacterium]|nr:hypothetical protein [Chlamydiia bacterium]